MELLFLVKILLEGFAVAIAAFVIPRQQMKIENIIAIALSASAVFLVLDQLAPEIGASARQGAGFGIGLNQVGWMEPFEDCKLLCKHNPKNCKSPGPCQKRQYGGKHCSLQNAIDVGTDVSGNLVRYGSHCTDYHSVSSAPTVVSECVEPTDLEQPVGLRTLPPQWSLTNLEGRRMAFDESGCPVNKNTNEYKLVPGLYSKYALQSGYNENVQTYNSNQTYHDSIWITDPVFDQPHYQEPSAHQTKMGMY